MALEKTGLPIPIVPIVTLRDVTCGYEGKTVLRNLDLDLPTGVFAGLVGPSGSGKTTLLRTILGQVTPTAGQITVNGTTLNPGGRSSKPPVGIGYVPQLEAVDWNFPVTVEQVILMGRYRATNRWLPWSSQEDRWAMQQLLERLGLESLARNHIRELSGGQQQRVFLARALISQPSLLLLDEPTSGVDVKTRNEVLALLGELNTQGITILLTTHDLNSVAAYLPYVICINGAIQAQGTPQQVFTSDVLSCTYNAPLEVLHHKGHLLVVEAETGEPMPLVSGSKANGLTRKEA